MIAACPLCKPDPHVLDEGEFTVEDVDEALQRFAETLRDMSHERARAIELLYGMRRGADPTAETALQDEDGLRAALAETELFRRETLEGLRLMRDHLVEVFALDGEAI